MDLAIGRKFVLSSGLCLKFVEEEWLFRRSAPSDRGQLILVSLLEWVGVFTAFITTGMLMGISVDIFQILPLFIAASVIGIVSMIPGELGTFDVMMIMGMGSLNIPEKAS